MKVSTVRGSESALKAEWLKARSVPETWALALGALAVGLGWAIVPVIMNHASWVNRYAADGGDAQISSMLWLGITRLSIIVALLLGATLLTGDRDTGTATATRIVHPRPLHVYAAKLGVATCWGFGIGAFTGLGVPLGLRSLLGPMAAPFTTSPVILTGYGFRVAVITALCAALGLALAAATRSLLVTAVIGFMWVWFESTVTNLLDNISGLGALAPWRNLSYFIDKQGDGAPFPWSYHWGFLPLVLITLVLIVIGARLHHGDNNTIKE
jgi:membrane protein